jgi:thymidylate synthase
MISTTQTIRNEFAKKYAAGEIVRNDTGSLSGADTVEIIGASFIADEDSIFDEPNADYIARELEWYRSASLNVNDIPGGTPKIWQAVSDADGFINSNYGYLVFDAANGAQYDHVLLTLLKSPSSRRATMIYTRPTMHTDFNANGMQDFVCTNAVQFLIRDNKLHAVVQMRSNDAWAGYRNDYAWQRYVQTKLLKDLNDLREQPYEAGDIHWQVASLHVYQKQFHLIENYIATGEKSKRK